MRHIHGKRMPITGRLSLLLPLLLGGLSTAAQAQYTWSGASIVNKDWSNPGNWNTVPVSASTTTLDFMGSAATSINNLGSTTSAFQLNAMQFDVSSAITLSGNPLDFVSNGGATPTLTQNSGSTVTLNNNLTLTNDLTVNLAGAGNVNLGGVISGAGGLIISGNDSTYTAVLSNSNNTYGGATTVAGGVLQLGANYAISSGNDLFVTGENNFGATATLDLNGFAATVGNITFGDGNATNSTQIIDSSGSKGLLTLNGNITFNGAANNATPPALISSNLALAAGQHTIDLGSNGNYSNGTGAYDVQLAGQVSGSGTLNIGALGDTSAGIFVGLTQTNTYTGGNNIYFGELFLAANNALGGPNAQGAYGALTIANGTALYLYSQNPNTGVYTSYNQSIGSLADAGTFGGGNIYLGSAILTVGSNNASTTFTGSIADNDGFATGEPTGGSLVKVGTGTLTLGGLIDGVAYGNNYYTNSTTVQGGTLQLGIDDALPDIANGTGSNADLIVTTDPVANTVGTFYTNGFSQTVNNLTNSGGVVLVQGGSSSATLTVAGAYKQTGGTTQVDDTLLLTPGQDLTLTGGQLVGTGTIGNATTSGTITVTNSGSGTVRPGDLLPGIGTGTLTINGNYTQQSGGTLEIDLAGTSTNDYGKLVNNLAGTTTTLAGTLDFKLLNGFSPVGQTFDFLDYNALSGKFTTIAGLGNYDYSINYLANGGHSIELTVTSAVPEASTLLSAALMLGTGGLLLRRQRRLHKAESTPVA